ncbi:hypothetical protein ACWEOE_23370 [Amycolatopsis sp. NPDC004368]
MASTRTMSEQAFFILTANDRWRTRGWRTGGWGWGSPGRDCRERTRASLSPPLAIAAGAAPARITGVLWLTWPPEIARVAPPVTFVLGLLRPPALGALLAGHKNLAAVFSAAGIVGTILRLPSSGGVLLLQIATLAAILAHPRPTIVHTRQWLFATAATAALAFGTRWLGVVDDVAVAHPPRRGGPRVARAGSPRCPHNLADRGGRGDTRRAGHPADGRRTVRADHVGGALHVGDRRRCPVCSAAG